MHRKNRPLITLACVGMGLPLGFGLWVLGKATARPVAAASPLPATGATDASGTHTHSQNVVSAGEYHLAAQLNAAGRAEIYIYGAKEGQLSPIPTVGLDLEMESRAVFPDGSGAELSLKAKPYPNDPEGMSSRFVGAFRRRADQKDVGLELALPLDGRTYRVAWRPEDLRPQGTGGADPGMPQAVTSKEAQRLFLTPGGRYTQTDIAANGKQTALQKYGAQMSAHNPHPRPGERICPITDTAANPKFPWVVGGKTYLFCCPPCIEEFVKLAKEQPASIRQPEEYVAPAPRS